MEKGTYKKRLIQHKNINIEDKALFAVPKEVMKYLVWPTPAMGRVKAGTHRLTKSPMVNPVICFNPQAIIIIQRQHAITVINYPD